MDGADYTNPSRISPQEVRALRDRLGWTLKELADYLTVPMAQASAWEQGSEPMPFATRLALLRLAEVGRPGVMPPTAQSLVEGGVRRNGSALTIEADGSSAAGVIAVLVFLVAFIIGLIKLVSWAWSASLWFVQNVAGWPLSWIGVPTAIAAAFLLFLFRLKLRFFYGLVEIAIACAIGWLQLPKFAFREMPADYDAIALALGVLGGSVYFMVRGLDNCHQGLDSDRLLALLRKGKKGAKVVENLERLDPSPEERIRRAIEARERIDLTPAEWHRIRRIEMDRGGTLTDAEKDAIQRKKVMRTDGPEGAHR